MTMALPFRQKAMVKIGYSDYTSDSYRWEHVEPAVITTGLCSSKLRSSKLCSSKQGGIYRAFILSVSVSVSVSCVIISRPVQHSVPRNKTKLVLLFLILNNNRNPAQVLKC